MAYKFMTNEEAIKYLQQLYPNGGHCWLDEQRIEAIGMAIQALQEEPVKRTPADIEAAMQEVEDKSKAFTEAHKGESSDDILAQMRGEEHVSEQNLSNVERTIKDWKEESVSNPIDFEKELYKAFGRVKDFTLGMRIAKWFYDMGRKHNEPVSEDLEEEIVKRWKVLHGSGNPTPFDTFNGIACHFATWQKQQDQSTIELAEDHAMLAGMEKMKQQMMAKAAEGKVISYEGISFPVSNEIHKLGLEEGDKVKVIILKGE